jgi:SAM-dependent methyltransferase
VDPVDLTSISSRNELFKSKIESIIKNIKILDPACGSGRFLITVAEYLFKIYESLLENDTSYDIKKKIIENNLFGNDIEKKACLISKLRLLNWLNSEDHNYEFNFINERTPDFNKIESVIENNDIDYNMANEDFLLNFTHKNFDIIIGNPPYVENKKIINLEYKKKLTKKFHSAYKLYDISTLFIEQSIALLKKKPGVLAFLTPNKFLAANYGIRIRELLLKNTQIKEIINISSLPVFKRISAYPIIIFLLNLRSELNYVSIKKVRSISELKHNRWKQIIKFNQEKVRNLPTMVIPLSKNVELINHLYSRCDSLAERFEDLKIIYRPFGFINWAKNAKYIKSKVSSEKDLILLGTGNVNKYYIDFNKQIKIAQRKYSSSYFEFNETFENIWDDISTEKLIFREIAKNLTFTYDPGLFVSLTGLYFIKIPSLNTTQLFSLLAILNSELLNTVFKSLYGTLHMSGGYLRINGSFIKSLPIPKTLPNSLSQISKIIQFLAQLKYEILQNQFFNSDNDIEISFLNKNLIFFQTLSDFLVNQLYEISQEEPRIHEILKSSKTFPEIEFKYIYPYHKFFRFKVYSKEELYPNLKNIYKCYFSLNSHLNG